MSTEEARGKAYRAVFLDRDGVITRTDVVAGVPRPPSDLELLEILPGVREAIQLLRGSGLLPLVVTNQPDIAREMTTRAFVDAIHSRIRIETGIETFRVCPHDDSDECECRKPRPGLLVDAARELGIELQESFMVGDRYSDIEAGARAGCRTILIGDGYGEAMTIAPNAKATDLSAAATWIVEQLDKMQSNGTP